MAKKDPAVDKYIAKANDFAKPILTRLRETVHAACPDCEEAMKWSFPHFTYKGMLCSMAAFKAHCVFAFWKQKLVVKAAGKDGQVFAERAKFTNLDELPPKKVLTACVKVAMMLNNEGVKVKRPKKEKAPLVVPDDLTAALAKNKTAQATFDGFSPSHKREYVEWITEAKSDETRQRRLVQAIEWMAEGKSRHWKYAKC
jgi:uncharacterized protein YdeI (YjbR/CyaY-like superfamily)